MIITTDVKRPTGRIHNVVTSFNEQGYKRYGEKFIESFLRFWPTNVRLTVWYEGEDFPFTHGIAWRPIEEVEHLSDYMNALQFPIMHGIVGDHYNINYDARMGRKAFIQTHAAKLYGGKVFWLDADTVTFAPVPEHFLDEMLPDDKLCCFLGRDGWYYTESGFLGFNMDHPLTGKFLKNYRNVFVSGSIFTQPGWHDCYGFDAFRMVFNQPDLFKNLAEDLPHGTMHPFVNSALGRYMDHRKGPRKESRSTGKDLVAPRSEEYWNGQGNEASPA